MADVLGGRNGPLLRRQKVWRCEKQWQQSRDARWNLRVGRDVDDFTDPAAKGAESGIASPVTIGSE